MNAFELSRRGFLGAVAVGAAASAVTGHATAAAQEADGGSKLRLKKSVKIGMVGGEAKSLPLADKLKLLKRIGYDGVELDSPNSFETKEVLDAIQASGLPVHGVVDSVHWKQTLTSADPSVRQAGLDGLVTAIKDAKAYGASTVLLVVGVVDQNVSYADAYARSQAEIRKAIPVAEEHGVKILFENVWNNFLLSPLETARYIDEFESEFVGAYFDVGNVLRYGWPEHWIAALGKRIGKLDIKEFSRKKMNEEGLGKGFGVEIGEGDCGWSRVCEQLKAIGFFDGWATAEVTGGGEERLTEILRRMRSALDV